jgi:hypothetical protein
MTVLTIEAIRENPWNVVSHTLPPHPDPLLLVVAYLAADYCRQSERVLDRACLDGKYAPPGCRLARDGDSDPQCAQRVEEVTERIRELRNHCEIEGGYRILRL